MTVSLGFENIHVHRGTKDRQHWCAVLSCFILLLQTVTDVLTLMSLDKCKPLGLFNRKVKIKLHAKIVQCM